MSFLVLDGRSSLFIDLICKYKAHYDQPLSQGRRQVMWRVCVSYCDKSDRGVEGRFNYRWIMVWWRRVILLCWLHQVKLISTSYWLHITQCSFLLFYLSAVPCVCDMNGYNSSSYQSYYWQANGQDNTALVTITTSSRSIVIIVFMRKLDKIA
jgi:hypothetical protein